MTRIRQVRLRLSSSVLCIVAISALAQYGNTQVEHDNSALNLPKDLYVVSVSAASDQINGAANAVTIYHVLADQRLVEEVAVLSPHAETDSSKSTGDEILSIHDVGGFILVEYPKTYPRYVKFVEKKSLHTIETVNFDNEDYVVDTLNHSLIEGENGMVCDVWPLRPNPQAAPPSFDANGNYLAGATILRKVCKSAAKPAILRTNDWSQLDAIRLDGLMGHDEVMLLSGQDGHLVKKFAGTGDPIVKLGNMPAAFGPEPRRGANLSPVDCFLQLGSVACTGTRRVSLLGADERYLVISVADVRGRDTRREIFVRDNQRAIWGRFSLPGEIYPTITDVKFRLFGEWLVTAIPQYADTATTSTKESILRGSTLLSVGELEGRPILTTEDNKSSKSCTVPGKILMLDNLSDRRHIQLSVCEPDSEVVEITKEQSVLVRVHAAIFVASLRTFSPSQFSLAAFGPMIEGSHWAFYTAGEHN